MPQPIRLRGRRYDPAGGKKKCRSGALGIADLMKFGVCVPCASPRRSSAVLSGVSIPRFSGHLR